MPTIKEADEAKKEFKDTPLEKLLEREKEILKSFNGVEQDIPVRHKFWTIRNVIRAKRNNPDT
jgi:hypothetical protein